MDEVAPYNNGSNIFLDGPDVLLPPKQVVSMGMAIHELVTNAAKHGALSIPTAKVIVNRQINDHGWLHVHWAERDGPQVRPPDRSGFGRLLLERGLAHELKGNVKLDYAGAGLTCAIDFPLRQPTRRAAPT